MKAENPFGLVFSKHTNSVFLIIEIGNQKNYIEFKEYKRQKMRLKISIEATKFIIKHCNQDYFRLMRYEIGKKSHCAVEKI